MVNEPTSFRLSKECREVILEQSKRFGKTQTEVLEYMIMEFSPSSLMEKKLQKENKKRIRENWIKTHMDPTIEQAWNAGYKAGWYLFQIRKQSHLFRPKDPDEWLSLQA